jgi:hypothetical protein
VSVKETLTAAQAASTSEEVQAGRLLDLVDDDSRDLILKRRGSVRRRGWLVRRALAAADALGILLAFALTELLFPPDVKPQYDRISTHVEIVLFALTLPFWIVLGRVYDLYSSDEERTDHTSVDEFVGVFNMLTVGSWLFFALATVFDFANPSFSKLALFWLLAITLGLAANIPEDQELLSAGRVLYDALYRWCQSLTSEHHGWYPEALKAEMEARS